MHNLPRTGGTIISKCLGAQKDVALLSEIHPNGNEIWKKLKKPSAPDTPIFDPIYQAKEWNGLFNVNEYEMIKNSNFDFLKKIELIYEKAEENNKNLIIRDWAFVDFFGIFMEFAWNS